MDTTEKDDLGTRIRGLREKRKMTQPALATAAGISPRALWQIEKGHDPSVRILRKIAAALGVEPGRLL